MHHSYEGCPDNAAMAVKSAVTVADGPPALSAGLRARVAKSVGILRDAVRDYRKVVYASSLGAESIVLTDLIWTEAPEIQIATIDTGRLPEETLALLDRLERRYGRRMQVYTPQSPAVESFVATQGINGFYNGLAQRQSCCAIRKLEPFQRAIADYAAWVTGVRREQSVARSAYLVSERDMRYGLQKISPLLDWSADDVWTYIRASALPYNPLHDRGFPSIGCAPCTRAIEPGQDERAGRWWWENPDSRECGLQPRVQPFSTP